MDDRQLEQLFERFRERGDVAALGHVFDETAPTLAGLARRLTRDRTAAEDLVQATFLAAIENEKSFDRTRALMPWLAGILVRQAALARRKRSPELTIEAHEPHADADPLRQLAARELSDALALALERLSPADREVLVPLLLDEKRAVEIARELGRRPDTVHMRIHRGLVRLRRLLPAGFALGGIAAFWPRHGLANVRAEILRRAAHAVGGPPIAAATGSSTVLIGGVLMVKHLVLASGVLALALTLGWFARHRSMPTDAMSAVISPSASVLDGKPASDVRESLGADERSADAPDRSRAALATTSKLLAHIEILDVEGHGAPGVFVAMLDAARTVRSLETDAAGCIDLPASGERVDLFIARARSIPFHAEPTLAPGPQRIALPRGRELSGWVRVHGAAPDRPIELTLLCDRSPFHGTKVDTELAQLFGCEGDGVGSFRVKQACSANGEFRWVDLPEDWSGSIFVPRIYTLPQPISENLGEQTLRLASAATGLVVELERLPTLKGRVVDARDRKPVPGARLAFSVEHSNGDSMLDSGTEADLAGRFEMPLPNDLFDSLALILLRDAHGSGRGSGRWTRAEVGPDLDLGDLVLESVPSRDLPIFVRGPRGTPIAGAIARGDGRPCKPTDEHGRSTLENLPLKTKTLVFGAIGFWPKRLDVTPEESGPIEVVLEPGNELSIEVEGIPAELAGKVRVDLVCTEPPFDSSIRWLPETDMPSKSIGHAWSAVHPDGMDKPGHVRGSLTQDGRWIVENVKPGIDLSVQVVGTLNAVLAEEKVAPLQGSEQRHLAIRLKAENREIEGRVSTEDGRATNPLSILLRNAREDSEGAKADSDGRFRFSFLPEGELELSITKRGCVRHTQHVTVTS
jgi:RNA polymerase sigma-70 factor (ECF subfamily)